MDDGGAVCLQFFNSKDRMNETLADQTLQLCDRRLERSVQLGHSSTAQLQFLVLVVLDFSWGLELRGVTVLDGNEVNAELCAQPFFLFLSSSSSGRWP